MNRYAYDRRNVEAATFYGLEGVREGLEPHEQEKDLKEVIQGIRAFIKQSKVLIGMYEKLGKELESEYFQHQAQLLVHRHKEMEGVLPKLEGLIPLLRELGESTMKFIHENPTAGAREVSQLPAYRKYLEAAKPIIQVVNPWEEGVGIPDGTELENSISENCKIVGKFEKACPDSRPIHEGLLPASIFGFMYLVADTDAIEKLRVKHRV